MPQNCQGHPKQSKARLKDYDHQEELKEMWQLNVTWCPGWAFGIKQGHFIDYPSIWVYLIFFMIILEKGRPQTSNAVLTTSHLDRMSALLMWGLALITWPRRYLWGFFSAARVCANLLQLCPTLCYTMDCSPPGSSLHGILHTRTLEWVAMPSSRGSPWPRDQICVSSVSCNGSRFFTSCATWKKWVQVAQ